MQLLIDPRAKEAQSIYRSLSQEREFCRLLKTRGSKCRPHPYPFHETRVVCLEGFIQEGFVVCHIPARPNKRALTLSRVMKPFAGMTILKMEAVRILSVPFSFHYPINSSLLVCTVTGLCLQLDKVVSSGVILLLIIRCTGMVNCSAQCVLQLD